MRWSTILSSSRRYAWRIIRSSAEDRGNAGGVVNPLHIGDMIEFDGKTFILFYANTGFDREGQTIRLEGLDPLRAQRHLDTQAQQRVSLENQQELKTLLPVLKEQLED